MDFFSRIMHHATRLGLSKNGSMNMTVNSAFCNGLPSHKISIQLSICGMRWNELFGVEIHNQPANLTQLWEALESTWANIPVERF